jgi:tRNA G46 methylase TrmB
MDVENHHEIMRVFVHLTHVLSGTGILKEIYEQTSDAKAVCYPEWPLSYNQMLHQQQLEGLVQFMSEEKISLSNKHILEIGPGSGFWTQFFLQHPIATYTGIELTETATKNLQNKFPQHHFICSDVSAIKEHELSSEGYDFIFAAMVFFTHHRR